MSSEHALRELEAISARQVAAVRAGEYDELEGLEAQRRELIARLDRRVLSELAGRQPGLVGDLVANIQENDRLTRSALKQRLDRLGAELGRHGARRRAEHAYLKMSHRG